MIVGRRVYGMICHVASPGTIIAVLSA